MQMSREEFFKLIDYSVGFTFNQYRIIIKNDNVSLTIGQGLNPESVYVNQEKGTVSFRFKGIDELTVIVSETITFSDIDEFMEDYEFSVNPNCRIAIFRR